jgi:hypothetical protein
MEDARRYDASEHTRELLAPYRDVILIWRAKYMSYEQISATLERHGLKVSPTAVGVYCRRHFTKAEILRERVRVEQEIPKAAATQIPLQSAVSRPASPQPGKRGPKIARDDY